MLKLNHSCVSLTDIRALLRKNCEVYVWDDEPSDGEPHHIVLNVEDNEGMHCVDLLPHEARAVAALLLAAADHQEALSKSQAGGAVMTPREAGEEIDLSAIFDARWRSSDD